jgi:hypothetical protein
MSRFDVCGQPKRVRRRVPTQCPSMPALTVVASLEFLYRTAEGVADFHAAGRHSHITEILRSGASLTEARELARHGDIRMTMRYTHIGIKDQANALAKLRVKSNPQKTLPDDQHRLGSAPAVSPCQNMTSGGESGLWESANENPCVDKGYRRKSPSDGECRKWRRRESNPIRAFRVIIANQCQLARRSVKTA